MGVYIKDMEMPTRCEDCLLCHEYETTTCIACGCRLNMRTREIGCVAKPEWCPIVEIPPHGRLGDLDKLEQMFVDIDNAPYSGFDGEEPFYSAEDAALIIRLNPTVIPADKDGET